jgi:hypothetical protein
MCVAAAASEQGFGCGLALGFECTDLVAFGPCDATVQHTWHHKCVRHSCHVCHAVAWVPWSVLCGDVVHQWAPPQHAFDLADVCRQSERLGTCMFEFGVDVVQCPRVPLEYMLLIVYYLCPRPLHVVMFQGVRK